MLNKPAHLSGTAGQIVNPIDTEEMFGARKAVQTIGDYVERALEAEQGKKKLTFDEWWSRFTFWAPCDEETAKQIWKEAQENV